MILSVILLILLFLIMINRICTGVQNAGKIADKIKAMDMKLSTKILTLYSGVLLFR